MVADRWATGFTDGTLDYAIPHGLPQLVVRTIAQSLQPLTSLSCEELREKSVAAIGALP